MAGGADRGSPTTSSSSPATRRSAALERRTASRQPSTSSRARAAASGAGAPRATAPRRPRRTRCSGGLWTASRAVGARPVGRARSSSGTPALPGRATGPGPRGPRPGRVRPAPAGRDPRGTLTAPAWTPLFTRAAAVVTDVGSAAAHASIIAREYGIPAVVGCVDATARLQTGCASRSTAAPGTSSSPKPFGPFGRHRRPAIV